MNLNNLIKFSVMHSLVSVISVSASAQDLLVDQASGTPGEFVDTFTRVPTNQIAQSFTPSLSAISFVQFSEYLPAFPGNDAVTLVVNLRDGAYNGPILSSTFPVALANKSTQIGTFFFPASVPVTPGDLYFLEPLVQSVGTLEVGYKAPSSYFGGDAWNNGLQDTGDYWFREGIIVPEPGTISLLASGSAVLVWLVRRKKQNEMIQ